MNIEHLEKLSLLRDESLTITDVNKIIVTSFLRCNSIKDVRNKYISRYILSKDDEISNEHLRVILESIEIETFDSLIKSFEVVISPLDKVVTGAVYTPRAIREGILDRIIPQLIERKEGDIISICDPSCGCGGFLYSSVVKLKEELNEISYSELFSRFIYGLDLKEYSVERTKILLCLLAIVNGEDKEEFDFNIFSGNALNFDWHHKIEDFKGFDAVVGNPPYVASRNIDNESASLLKNWKVCSTGHPDLYIPFFEIGMSILEDSGLLGFITMNTFFKSLNGRALREYFSHECLKLSITDFGSHQVFKSKNTYTCICIVEKEKSDSVCYRKVNSIYDFDKSRFNEVLYSNLDNHNGWNLSRNDLISKIESIGTPLKDIYNVNSGIATLKNNIYIIEIESQDSKYYTLRCGSKVEKDICCDIVNPNKLIDESDLSRITGKIIFPYNYVGVNPVIIEESVLSSKYPKAYSYLLSKKELLKTRDKGKKKYEKWYAYGRKQGLVKYDYTLLFPHITPRTPNFSLSDRSNLLFHNGIGVISNDKKSLEILKVIMSSRLFWFYVSNTSKPYGSGYFSLSRNYIKSFGIYPFSDAQVDKLISSQDRRESDRLIEELYGINLDSVV